MSTTITCPNCEARLRLPQTLTPGTSLICPECSEAIRVPETSVKTGSPRAVAPPLPKKKRPSESDIEDSTPTHRKPRRMKQAKKGGNGWLGLMIGLGAGGLLLAGCAVALAIIFWPSDKPSDNTKEPSIKPVVLAPGRFSDEPDKPIVAPAVNPPPRPAPEEPRVREPDPQPPPTPVPPAPRDAPPDPPKSPRSLDWAGLSVAGVSVGNLNARSVNEFDALGYLPPSTDAVLGLDSGTLGNNLTLNWLMQKIATLGDDCPLDILERETGFHLSDLDHIVVAAKVDFSRENWNAGKPFPFEATTYAIKAKSPFNRASLLQNAKAGPPKRAFEKEYYSFGSTRKGKQTYLFFPTDRIVVVSVLPEAQFAGILKQDGVKPALPSETLAVIRALGQSHAWVVMPPGLMKSNLPTGAPLIATLLPGIDAMAGSKSVGLSLRMQGEQVKLTIALAAADPTGAKAMTSNLQDYWNKQGRAAVERIMGGFLPGFQPVLSELAKGLQWQTQGECAIATAGVTFKSLDELLKAAE